MSRSSAQSRSASGGLRLDREASDKQVAARPSVISSGQSLPSAIALARADRETLTDIGNAAGLTAERVRQIVLEEQGRGSTEEGAP
jgi:hypothetical protein